MIKNAAMFIVAVSSFTAAFLVIRHENEHKKYLRLLMAMIEKIGDRAIFYKKPLLIAAKEICSDNKISGLIFINEFIKEAERSNDVPSAWSQAVNECNMYLTDSEKDSLIRFGEDMCKCFSDKLQEIISGTKRDFDAYIRASEAKQKEKTKVTSVLTISAGLIVVLVFV